MSETLLETSRSYKFKIVALSTIIILIFFAGTLLLFPEAFADKYTNPYMATLEGKYDNKNGIFILKGNPIFKGKPEAPINLVGQLKEWNYYDSSIPNCKHAFSDKIMLYDDAKTYYAELIVMGKICSANWDDGWKTFRGNYIIVNGRTLGTDQVAGKGIIDLTMNTKTGKTIGLLNGYITLVT